MSYFLSLCPAGAASEGPEVYNLSFQYDLLVHKCVEDGSHSLAQGGETYFLAELVGLSSGSDDSEQVGIGTGDSPAAALIDLLLDLAANDARLPADAAQKLDKIAQEAARLVVLYMTEKPLYEDGVPAGNQTLDPKREAAV